MATRMNKVAVIRYGAEGKDVEKLQKQLQAAGSKIKINGKYTIGMLSAIKAFQKKHNLPVTGEADAKTMDKLKAYDKTPAKSRATKTTKPAPAVKKPVAKKAIVTTTKKVPAKKTK